MMKGGIPVIIRPIQPADVSLLVAFHHTLSEHSVYLRYFQVLSLRQRIASERLMRICHVDYDRDMVLVVEQRQPTLDSVSILAVGRLTRIEGLNSAEFAIVVSDRCHGRGLGSELLRRLITVGRDRRFTSVMADIHPDNVVMLRICKAMGFRFMHQANASMLLAVCNLEQ